MITVDWGTKIISVPRSYGTIIQVSPEIRELDVDAFRLDLKDLEDDTEGMPYLDTHEHVGEKILSGVTYARFVEIINGYTVTFEDDQYAINLVGANNNILDVTNRNQVSIAVNNSAGLIVASSTDTVKVDKIIDILEADEELTETKAYKRKKGTSTVLIEKNVTGGSIDGPITLEE